MLTDANGVVLNAVGDGRTLEQGQGIHLMPGGDWREDVVGTNGIGTALATGRPAQVHAAEHFCEGIKSWTCAGAPIFEPGTNDILGVIDISGPPSTYQRTNLTLAVTAARQIEAALGEQVAQERMRLLEVCLQRISGRDAAGLIALDSAGRLVHATGRIPSSRRHRRTGAGAGAAFADRAMGGPAAGRLAAGMAQPGLARRPRHRRCRGHSGQAALRRRAGRRSPDRRRIPRAAASTTSSAAAARWRPPSTGRGSLPGATCRC